MSERNIPELRAGLTIDVFMEMMLDILPVGSDRRRIEDTPVIAKDLKFGDELVIPQGTVVQNLGNGLLRLTTRPIKAGVERSEPSGYIVWADPKQGLNEAELEQYNQSRSMIPSNNPKPVAPELHFEIDPKRAWMQDRLPLRIAKKNP